MAKIVFIASQRLPTEKAYGLQIAKMCEAFADSGASVELLIPSRQNNIAQDFFTYYGVRRNFTIIIVPAPDFYFFGIFDRIAFKIKQGISSIKLVRAAMSRGADIIFSRDELPIFWASFYSRHPKLVFEAHKFSSSKLYRRFKKNNVKIVTISKGLKDMFIKKGFNSDNILVAHDGVDLAQFTINKTMSECRNILELPQNKIIILYTGHFYEWKGAGTLLETARNFKNPGNVLFVFVGGTGADIKDFKNRVSKMELDNVMILGFVPHNKVPLYLRAADILILPNSGKEDISRFYTSPLKMFEYMTSGKPIIASDLPSIREVLTENTAFFSQPDNVENLTIVINKVIDNMSEAEKRANQALKEVLKYSWSARAGSILNFIKS